MPREVVYGTGKQEIRTVAKVDLSQPASEQTVLHVRNCTANSFSNPNKARIVGIQIVRPNHISAVTIAYQISSICLLNQRWRDCKDRMR